METENKPAAALRADLENAVAKLKDAEGQYHKARQGKERAIQLASARGHLNATEEHKSAASGILEAAAEVEGILHAYLEAANVEYAESLKAATVESRALYEQRPELVQALADIDKAIAAAEEKEKSDVSLAVGRRGYWQEYGQGVNEFKTGAVRLVLEDQARGAQGNNWLVA